MKSCRLPVISMSASRSRRSFTGRPVLRARIAAAAAISAGLAFLAAEAAAHAPALHDDAIGAGAQGVRHDALHLGGVLGRAQHQHAAVFLRDGRRDLPFEVEMILAADDDGCTQTTRQRGRAARADRRGAWSGSAAHSSRRRERRGYRAARGAASRRASCSAPPCARRASSRRRRRTAAARHTAPPVRRKSGHRGPRRRSCSHREYPPAARSTPRPGDASTADTSSERMRPCAMGLSPKAACRVFAGNAMSSQY